MNQKLYFKITYFLPVALLILFTQSGYTKANFPIAQSPQSIEQVNKNILKKVKPFKSKRFKKAKTKERGPRFFGLLAILAFVCCLFSLALLSITNLGAVVAGLFFFASCLFAYYGTSKDRNRGLAKLTLIVNLVIVLSTLLSFWIATIISL